MAERIVPLEQARRTLEETRERALGRIEEVRARRLGGSPAGIIPEIQRRIENRMAVLRERRPLMGGGSQSGQAEIGTRGQYGEIEAERPKGPVNKVYGEV